MQFLYFLLAGSASYLVNVFIFPFLDHSQGFYYYWRDSNFKEPDFLNYYFLVFVSSYFMTFFDVYIILSWFSYINLKDFLFHIS